MRHCDQASALEAPLGVGMARPAFGGGLLPAAVVSGVEGYSRVASGSCCRALLNVKSCVK